MNALTPANGAGLSLPNRNEWSTIADMAAALVASGLLPKHIKRKEEAIAIILKGRELDVPPWTALTKIHVVEGVPTVAPELMLGLVYRSGLMEDITIDDPEAIRQNKRCTVTVQRVGKSPHTSSFSILDAEEQGLTGKYNWHKMPYIMLKWRAVSDALRTVFPDVVSGMYTPEEIVPDAPINEAGEFVVEQEPDFTPPPAPEPDIKEGEEVSDSTLPSITRPERPRAPAPTQPERPYSPDDLRNMIAMSAARRAKKDETLLKVAGDNRHPAVWATCNALEELFRGNRDEKVEMRKLLTGYLVDEPSTKNMTIAQLNTLLAWATTQPARAEAERVVSVARSIASMDA